MTPRASPFQQSQLTGPGSGLASRLSTRSVRLAQMILIQAIRSAMVNDLVVRNVADLSSFISSGNSKD